MRWRPVSENKPQYSILPSCLCPWLSKHRWPLFRPQHIYSYLTRNLKRCHNYQDSINLHRTQSKSGNKGGCCEVYHLTICFQVASRRVIIYTSVMLLAFSVLNKFGALFITVPDPVIGGSFLVLFGKQICVCYPGSNYSFCIFYVSLTQTFIWLASHTHTHTLQRTFSKHTLSHMIYATFLLSVQKKR